MLLIEKSLKSFAKDVRLSLNTMFCKMGYKWKLLFMEYLLPHRTHLGNAEVKTTD